jgi:hypothetical protein
VVKTYGFGSSERPRNVDFGIGKGVLAAGENWKGLPADQQKVSVQTMRVPFADRENGPHLDNMLLPLVQSLCFALSRADKIP